MTWLFSKNPLQSLFVVKGWFVLGLSLFLVSCAASVSVKPEVSISNNLNRIIVMGNVLYEGNPNYLPRTVKQKSETDITIKYEYTVSYDGSGKEEALLAMFFAPLPTGYDDVIAIGKMELLKNTKIIKGYTSGVRVSKLRSLFLGGVDKTELRRMALLSLKENIEIQMTNDYALLSQFSY